MENWIIYWNFDVTFIERSSKTSNTSTFEILMTGWRCKYIGFNMRNNLSSYYSSHRRRKLKAHNVSWKYIRCASVHSQFTSCIQGVDGRNLHMTLLASFAHSTFNNFSARFHICLFDIFFSEIFFIWLIKGDW